MSSITRTVWIIIAIEKTALRLIGLFQPVLHCTLRTIYNHFQIIHRSNHLIRVLIITVY